MTKAHKERIAQIQLEMKELAETENWDKETTHSDADDLLCELLIILGYSDVANNFEEIDKWYA